MESDAAGTGSMIFFFFFMVWHEPGWRFCFPFLLLVWPIRRRLSEGGRMYHSDEAVCACCVHYDNLCSFPLLLLLTESNDDGWDLVPAGNLILHTKTN